MNGARMRSNSLSGTRPRQNSASVPRLSAPYSARTRTSPGPQRRERFLADFGAAGPTYQSACATSSVRLVATFLIPVGLLRRLCRRYILHGPSGHQKS